MSAALRRMVAEIYFVVRALLRRARFTGLAVVARFTARFAAGALTGATNSAGSFTLGRFDRTRGTELPAVLRATLRARFHTVFGALNVDSSRRPTRRIVRDSTIVPSLTS